MQFPPTWWGRRRHVPARSRIAQLRAVLGAAQSVEGYRERLREANLATLDRLKQMQDVESTLASLKPLPLRNYQSLFLQRQSAMRRAPVSGETRSAWLVPYAQARTGIHTCHQVPPDSLELYTPRGIAEATADLYNLSQSLQATALVEDADHGLVVFSGVDAGLLTPEQRHDLWDRYQVPLFEQFLGTDGRVMAAECELHAGLHIRPEAAVFELLNDELVMTSLTDEATPALRIQSEFTGQIDREPCECGRTEPRLIGLRTLAQPKTKRAAA